MMRTYWFFIGIFFLGSLRGEIFTSPFDRFSPWQGPDALIDSYLTGQGKTRDKAWLFEAGLFSSIFDWKGGLSMAFSSSKKRNLQFDNATLNIQYTLLNDAIGDPISLAAGFALGGIYKRAFFDPSFIHYGQFEGRIYATLGSETAPREVWVSRLWGFGSFGIAERGVTFGEAFVIWEKQFCRRYSAGIFSMIQGNYKPMHQVVRYRRAWDNGLQATILFEEGTTFGAKCFLRSFTKGTKASTVICLYLDYPWSL